MILINPTLDYNVRKFIRDKKGRFIILEVFIEDNPIVLVNIIHKTTPVNRLVSLMTLTNTCKKFAIKT